MHRYCRVVSVGKVDRGDFYESRVQAITDEPFHEMYGFVDAFALRLMDRYERQPVDTTLEIDPAYLDNPERTKHFYRRLFDKDGNHTQEFITIASETIGLWIEDSLEHVLYAYGGIPHNSDPAYDVLSIYDEEGTPRLRAVQVKATEEDLQANCNKALAKFEQLENGDYNAELSASIDLIVEHRRAPDGLIARELKLNRRYRVTVVHGQERDGILIMTTYHEKIRGDPIRRSSVLMKIHWPNLWECIAGRVYAQLT